ncbi:MAG: CRISPR-associated protein Csx20, partial [Pseudomonadota bacterium]
MSVKLFLIFNHTITEAQRNDARNTLGVEAIVELPPHLQTLWSNIPADMPELTSYLEPLRDRLKDRGKAGDFVLIQGDFGATYLMVRFALEQGLVPVYSTTKRRALEELLPDGSVKLVHNFQHVG